MIASSLSPETEGRTAGRSNVFVIAALYCAAGSTPVRIRNLSPTGALVEGSVLPMPGSAVRLSRGSLQAPGEVVWSADGRAGLRFGCSIAVSDWLPGASAPSAQQSVDEVVFKAKLNSSEAFAPSVPISPTSGDIALELGALASGLTRLCEQLADDPYVAARFPANLQVIEATAQRLNRLAGAAVLASKKF